MATIIDSFLVTLESKADSSGFDLFDQLSRRFVITLGDVINLAERAAGALGRMFAPALEADVLAAKIKGFRLRRRIDVENADGYVSANGYTIPGGTRRLY